MDISELAGLYQRALQVQDATVRDLLSNAVARIAATQSVLDGQPEVASGDARATVANKALVAKVRKDVVATARAVADALKNPKDVDAAHAVAAEAIAAEAVAAEAIAVEAAAAEPVAAEPFAAEPFAAEPFAAEPLAAEPFAAEPFSAEPLAAEPFAAEPFAAEPFAAEPFAAEPFAAEPFAAEPFAAEPFAAEPTVATAADNPMFTAALNAFVNANRGGGTGR